MAWLVRKRAAQLAAIGALTVMSVACSSEDKKPTDEDTDNVDGDGTTAEGEDVDARPLMDASKPPPPPRDTRAPDAGDAGAPITLTPIEPLLPPDASVIVTALTPLPHDGDKRSICYGESDCGNNDDLTCSLTSGIVPGVCVDDCRADKDCETLDGVKGTCAGATLLSDGQCTYGCNGPKNDGKGSCPKDMVCTNLGGGTLLTPDTWRCRYPEFGGKKTEKSWGKCIGSHGPGDCEGLASCVFLAGDISSALAPHGYCSPVCSKDADCKVDEGTTAIPHCVLSQCIITCDNPGARCPEGMNCDDIDTILAQSRVGLACVYFD